MYIRFKETAGKRSLDISCRSIYDKIRKLKISENLLVLNQPLQVPQGFIEKPVRFRYDPVTVLGSFGAEICHWVCLLSGL